MPEENRKELARQAVQGVFRFGGSGPYNVAVAVGSAHGDGVAIPAPATGSGYDPLPVENPSKGYDPIPAEHRPSGYDLTPAQVRSSGYDPIPKDGLASGDTAATGNAPTQARKWRPYRPPTRRPG